MTEVARAPAPLSLGPAFSPQKPAEETTSYRPVKDKEAFRKLVPPVEFVEGSSSGAFAIPEGKFQPINDGPSSSSGSKHEPESPRAPLSSSPATPKESKFAPAKTSTPLSTNTKHSSKTSHHLYDGAIDISWPKGVTHIGAGLHNTGNTCFLNSALQCLLHTPGLLHILLAHTKTDPCRAKGFCMSCCLRGVLLNSHFTRQRSFTPAQVTNNLSAIAKHLRRGRQEDSHEFLRYAIDALQKSCLAGYPPKLDPKLAETTWVHKLFGGKLRSRVTCQSCGHNSDTFDNILDLSIDIFGASSVQQALKKFVAIDSLKGADKYKCDACKRRVVAEKRFTIHEAPVVLTIHLKRFSPLGRKIGHAIKYDEKLTLAPYMSEGQFGPSYALYGVISHAGGGPNSGHYYAHVRGPNGSWYEMNDETVTPAGMGGEAPTGLRSAYMLFYVMEKGQALQAAVGMNGAGAYVNGNAHSNGHGQNGAVNGRNTKSVIGAMNGKRKSIDREMEEEKTTPNKRPFIGPVMPSQSTLPSPSPTPSPSPSGSKDPQALALKRKIEAVKAKQGQRQGSPSPKPKQMKKSNALLAISQEYGDEDDEDEEDGADDVGEKVVMNGTGKEKGKEKEAAPQSPPQSPTTSKSTSAPPPHPPASLSPTPTPAPTAASSSQPASSPAPIPPSSFYGTVPPTASTSSKPTNTKGNKRKSPSNEDDDEPPQTPKSAAVNINGFKSPGSNTPRIIGIGGGGDPYERTSSMFRQSDKWNPKKYGGGWKKRRTAL
ncbi:cysteine proteinase [Stereum hirsutum FP-91666 SS1]|uniref:cysteine proteinase n=1 Tax=Stereum hirsutum (strain FP-91666) TaxID=721885 RepID=UPI0004449369|nr:cysteine proteinase [Stereum hirsutum FP-91666 SS1]EIM85714.1 cysteine proteinase [Stereum hirsutum FP-91666 SS1]